MDNRWLAPLYGLIYSNVFIACCAVALAISTQLAHGAPWRFDPSLGLIGAATLFVYNLDRVMGTSPEDLVAMSPRHAWSQAKANTLWSLTLLGAAGIAYFGALMPLALLWGLVPLGLLSVAYSAPVLPLRRRWYRLKDIPGLKLFLIAWVWAAATVYIPLSVFSAPALDGPLLWALAARTLFIVGITLPFDLRDLEADREAGVITLPQLLGSRRTCALSCVVVVGAIAMELAQLDNAALRLAWVLSGAAALALILATARRRHELYYGLGLDGTMLLPALLYALLSA